jgi:hypothetical protein
MLRAKLEAQNISTNESLVFFLLFVVVSRQRPSVWPAKSCMQFNIQARLVLEGYLRPFEHAMHPCVLHMYEFHAFKTPTCCGVRSYELRARPQKSVFLAMFSGLAKPKSPTSRDKYATTINYNLL